MQERRAPGGALWLAVPAAALLGLLAPALSGRAILAFRDMLQTYWPMKAVFWGSPGPLLTTWNPWFFGGMPLLGDLVQQPLYLPNLAFRALRVPAWPGIAWYLALHGLLALGSAALLFRRIASPAAAVLGATVFVLSGFMLADASNLNWYCAAAWAPLVLYACDRVAREGRVRDGALLALSFAHVVLASDPQLALTLAACCAAILWLRFQTAMQLQPSPFSRAAHMLRERAAPLALAAAGAAVLCLPQIVASLQLLQLVVRGSSLAQDAARETWSFHPARIPELWVPRLYGPLFDAGYWGGFTVSAGWKRPFVQSVYAGAAWPALLGAALLMRRRAALLSLAGAAGFGLLALGPHGFHLYALLARLVPTWSLYRYPERLLLLPTLAAACIAALGADALPALHRRTRIALAAGSGALSLASLARAAALAPSHPWHEPAAHGAVLRSALQLGLATLLACAAMGASRRFVPLLVVLFAADLCAANGELLGLLPRAPFLEPPRICQDIARAAGPLERGSFRVFDDQAALRADTGQLRQAASALPAWGRSRWLEYSWGKRNVMNLCGLRAAVALTSFEPRDATALWRAAGPVRALAALSTRFAITARGSTLSRAAGVRQFTVDPALDAVLLELPEALQRLYRPESVEHSDEAAVLTRVAGEPLLLTRRLALLAGPPLEHARAGAARVAAFEESADRIVFSIEHDAPGYWVLTDSLDSSWSATVDGAPAPLQRADLAHRAIWLPAGRHEVALRARPGALGWLIAAALICLCCLCWLAARREAQASSRTPGAAI